MRSTSRVLVVDESSDTREVLCALLARSGAQTLEAAGAEQAVQLTRAYQPDLIIYDAESDHSYRRQASGSLGTVASHSQTPVVVLGTAKRQLEELPTGQFISKPYHYGPLIRRIEDLLGTRA